MQAYVQQLESSKLRLLQIEQELGRARQQVNEASLLVSQFVVIKRKTSKRREFVLQGLYVGGAVDASPSGYAGSTHPGLYGHTPLISFLLVGFLCVDI